MGAICLDDDMMPFLDRAKWMGRRDYNDRIPIQEGYDTFKLAGATTDELIAYATGWSDEHRRAFLKAQEIG